MVSNEEIIVDEIKKKVSELNNLFEKAQNHYIRFDCNFDQSKSFGKGKVAHLDLTAYRKI